MRKILEVKKLTKKYKDKEVLSEVSFVCHEGETLAIIGHNGAGKSTMLDCICNVKQKSSGEVEWHIENEDLYNILGVHRQMNYYEEMATVKDLYSLYESILNIKTDIVDYLATFGLSHLINSEIRTLSGGETQKLTLALALMKNPKILILDEMTAGVDLMSKQNLWEYIRKLRESRKMTILLVTHDLEEVKRYTDRVIVMKNGRIELDVVTQEMGDLEKVYIDIHEKIC